jgi:hypothetical protein
MQTQKLSLSIIFSLLFVLFYLVCTPEEPDWNKLNAPQIGDSKKIRHNTKQPDPIKDVIRIKSLAIFGNNIKDISCLSSLKNLEIFTVSKDSLNDCSSRTIEELKMRKHCE